MPDSARGLLHLAAGLGSAEGNRAVEWRCTLRTTLLVAALIGGSIAMTPTLRAQSSGSLRAVARVYRPPSDRESLAEARMAVKDWTRHRQPGGLVRRGLLARVRITPSGPARNEDPAPRLVVDIEYLRN